MPTIAPVPAIVYATQAGGTTLDQDSFGGNPFATALIDLSNEQGLELKQLLPALRKSTLERSARHQTPTWDRVSADEKWTFTLSNAVRQEKRIALVLVVSEYTDSENHQLLGAARDERRISSMLAGHGFSVTQGVAPDKRSLHRALRSFTATSKESDVAIVYSTGHGVEYIARPFLLPGDYPFSLGYGSATLRRHALPVAQIASACKARKLNLTFFAGCRTLVAGP